MPNTSWISGLSLEGKVLRAACAADKDGRFAAATLGGKHDRGRLVDISRWIEAQPSALQLHRRRTFIPI
jgi:hypothetical protein